MTSSPRLSVAPMTPPVWMPPPAQMLEKARGQWSRPGCSVPAGALASPRAGAAVEADLRRAAELAGDDDEHALVQSARVDVLDERGDRLVVVRQRKRSASKTGAGSPRDRPSCCTRPHSGPLRLAGDDLHARFDQPAREQQLLAPAIAPVAIAGARVFLAQIERIARLRIGQQRHRLRFELIERAEFALRDRSRAPACRGSAAARRDRSAAATPRRSERPMLGTSKFGRFGSSSHRERRIRVAQIGGAVVFERRIHADVVRQRIRAPAVFRAQIVGHRHPVRQLRLRLVARVGVAREHLHRARRMAAAPSGSSSAAP